MENSFTRESCKQSISICTSEKLKKHLTEQISLKRIPINQYIGIYTHDSL